MKRYILLFLLFAAFYSKAQINIDSLKTVWNNTTLPDTTRLNAVSHIIWNGYLQSQPDTAFYFATEELEFAKSIKNEKWIVKSLTTQGVVKLATSDYEEALSLFFQGLELCKKIGFESYLTSVLTNIGTAYYRMSEYDKALQYYNQSYQLNKSAGISNIYINNNLGLIYTDIGEYDKAFEVYEQNLGELDTLDNNFLLGSTYNNIAIVYKKKGLYKQAINYYFKSLKTSEIIGDSLGTATAIGNIGGVYEQLEEYDKALVNYQKALKIEEKIGNKLLTSQSVNNIGGVYLVKKEFDKAYTNFTRGLYIGEDLNNEMVIATSLTGLGRVLEMRNKNDSASLIFTKALILRNKLDNKEGIIELHILIGNLYLKTNAYPAAIEYFKKALQMARTIGIKPKVKTASQQLFICYQKLGIYGKALDMHILYTATNDSLQFLDYHQQLRTQEIEYKYEKQALADSLSFAKKEEIKDLKISEQANALKFQRLQSSILYGGVIILLLLSSFAFYGYRQKSKANDLIISQKEELQSQNDEIERQHIQLLETNTLISEFNLTLESKVKERTSELEQSVEQLRYYHNDLAHNVRAPLATLIGLVNIVQDERFDDKEKEKVLRLLSINSLKIDKVIKGISDNLTDFDEYWEEKMEGDGKSKTKPYEG